MVFFITYSILIYDYHSFWVIISLSSAGWHRHEKNCYIFRMLLRIILRITQVKGKREKKRFEKMGGVKNACVCTIYIFTSIYILRLWVGYNKGKWTSLCAVGTPRVLLRICSCFHTVSRASAQLPFFLHTCIRFTAYGIQLCFLLYTIRRLSSCPEKEKKSDTRGAH